MGQSSDRASALRGDQLATASTEVIRARRSNCQSYEARVSYLRRLVQGRLDIVEHERRRRREGQPPADLALLVAEIADALGDDQPVRSNSGRPVDSFVARGELSDEAAAFEHMMTAKIDGVLDAPAFAHLQDRDDTELADMEYALRDLEREVSERRRSLHAELDVLTQELARRYKTGEATVETVLDA